MDFGTYPTGWHIEGDLPNQVAVKHRFHCITYEFEYISINFRNDGNCDHCFWLVVHKHVYQENKLLLLYN